MFIAVMKKFRYTILLVFVLFVSCINEQPTGGADLHVGDSLPVFEVVMNDGSAVNNATLQGVPALIVFFNTGCPDCRQELPVIEQFYLLQEQAKKQMPSFEDASGRRVEGESVKVVCISREQTEEEVAAYWYAKGFTMLYSAQSDRSVYELFAQSRIPRVYAVNEKGIIIAMWDDTDMPTLEDLQKAFL